MKGTIMANVSPSYSASRVKPLYRGTQIVWYILGIIQTLLAFRFILRLIAANPAAGFTDLIYTISQPLVQLFSNIVAPAQIARGVIDWNILIAMLVYWLLAWGIVRLFFMGRPVTESEAEYEIHRENDKI